MEYLKPKFTLPACGNKVTQEQWNRIFGCPECGQVGFHKMSCDSRPTVQVHTTFKCGHELDFVSPGVLDPLGQFVHCAKASDGKVYCTDIFACHECQLASKQMQVALSQADGWASDGQMAGGTRDHI